WAGSGNAIWLTFSERRWMNRRSRLVARRAREADIRSSSNSNVGDQRQYARCRMSLKPACRVFLGFDHAAASTIASAPTSRDLGSRNGHCTRYLLVSSVRAGKPRGMAFPTGAPHFLGIEKIRFSTLTDSRSAVECLIPAASNADVPDSARSTASPRYPWLGRRLPSPVPNRFLALR
ncbi:hypothetical protein FRB90_001143, partial [Tulasnella sp. 427]